MDIDDSIKQSISCCGRNESETVARLVVNEGYVLLIVPNDRFEEGGADGYKRIKVGNYDKLRESILRGLDYMDKLLIKEKSSDEYDI